MSLEQSFKRLYGWLTQGSSTFLCSAHQIKLDRQLADIFNAKDDDPVRELGMVLVLLKGGANPNLELEDGSRLLHRAAAQGRLQCAGELLNSGALPSFADWRGDTPLHVATKATLVNSEPHMVQLLLDHDADPNAPGEGANTPLHYAARGGCHSIVAALLEAGADPLLQNEFHATSIQAAEIKGHVRLARMLNGAAVARAGKYNASSMKVFSDMLFDTGVDEFEETRNGFQSFTVA
mmetsp:Transcript_26385/g.50122  ORF Transcript_26385/g.50122 Transcript_26385/m.50122 type:complete len:236 (-) Transcript_26385:133-840(-)|eukprot:CAMPEP_0114237836 /NCGR_PEP_ID=MMETSP0058-20121206/7604_1 /TAXON_ID=36894 /ORGANISM="Pyramimonas parkeae, CCMP726" /LENGTH=235 /DNA_ID=CAMNT_0001349907 /DNA_START=91 /DNA_END=798 /DNA_ORIENTATION=-